MQQIYGVTCFFWLINSGRGPGISPGWLFPDFRKRCSGCTRVSGVKAPARGGAWLLHLPDLMRGLGTSTVFLLGIAYASAARVLLDAAKFLHKDTDAQCSVFVQNGTEGLPSLISDCPSLRPSSADRGGQLVLEGSVDEEPFIEFRHASGAKCQLFMHVDAAGVPSLQTCCATAEEVAALGEDVAVAPASPASSPLTMSPTATPPSPPATPPPFSPLPATPPLPPIWTECIGTPCISVDAGQGLSRSVRVRWLELAPPEAARPPSYHLCPGMLTRAHDCCTPVCHRTRQLGG
jgi:hypothetical protein